MLLKPLLYLSCMTRQINDEEKRQGQNVAAVVLLFIGTYFFFNGQMNLLTAGITWIMGFGASPDARHLGLFVIKYLFAKIMKNPLPSYDFSHGGMINQRSGRDSYVFNGPTTIHR